MDLSFYKGKNVLVTGHTGFKGSWLCKVLLLAGANVYGYALKPDKKLNMYDLCHLDSKVKSYYGDIRDLTSLKKAFEESKPEIVFHLAAQPIVKEGYLNPVYTYDVNIMGSVHVLECVKEIKTCKSLVMVTTDKVYQINDSNIYKENDALNGKDPYSNSKSCVELISDAYRKSFLLDQKIAISTLRAGNVLGGGDFESTRLLPSMIEFATNQKDIELRSLKSIRPYQFVLDCLNGYLLVALKQYRDLSLAGNYNIGPNYEDALTNEELTKIFIKKWMLLTGERLSYKQIDHEEFEEVDVLKLDTSKIKKVLGWDNKYTLEQALDLTINWYFSLYNREDVDLLTTKQIRDYYHI